MKLTWRSRLWIAPAALFVLLLLLGVAADAWLETSGGRQLLQRELSKSLGLPVRLEGDYHFTLIPRLKIVGTSLTLGVPSGETVWARSGNYSAAVELIPFMLGELRIAAVDLKGGAVDLDKLQRGVSDGAFPAGNGTGVLPQLASLQITDIFIGAEDEGDGVMVEHLQLSGFQPGQAAGLLVRAARMEGGVNQGQVNLHGELTVTSDIQSLILQIRDLQAEWPGQRVHGLAGRWQWNLAEEQLKGEMTWTQGTLALNWSLEIHTGNPVSGGLQGHLGHPALSGPLNFALEFAVFPGQIQLAHVEMGLSGQILSGMGCMLLSQPASLQLALAAGELDLDPLVGILAGREANETDLSLDLAIEVQVDKARFAGAVASDVVLDIGSRPDCGEPPNVRP